MRAPFSKKNNNNTAILPRKMKNPAFVFLHTLIRSFRNQIPNSQRFYSFFFDFSFSGLPRKRMQRGERERDNTTSFSVHLFFPSFFLSFFLSFFQTFCSVSKSCWWWWESGFLGEGPPMAEGLSERKETKKRRASGWAATLERGARRERKR